MRKRAVPVSGVLALSLALLVSAGGASLTGCREVAEAPLTLQVPWTAGEVTTLSMHLCRKERAGFWSAH